MEILVVVAHPNKKSFNHAIAHTSMATLEKSGHTVVFHDLYEDKFDPVLPQEEIPEGACVPLEIDVYCRALTSADGIIVVHPNWWGQPPAIMKGWIDRVFRPGVAYNFIEEDKGEGIPVGLLKAKAALVFNTSNTPEDREKSIFGDPLENIWKMCLFDLCGVKAFYRKMFGVMVTSRLEERKQWLKDVENVVRDYFPEK